MALPSRALLLLAACLLLGVASSFPTWDLQSNRAVDYRLELLGGDDALLRASPYDHLTKRFGRTIKFYKRATCTPFKGEKTDVEADTPLSEIFAHNLNRPVEGLSLRGSSEPLTMHKALDALRSKGCIPFPHGGTVRDALRCKHGNDIDLGFACFRPRADGTSELLTDAEETTIFVQQIARELFEPESMIVRTSDYVQIGNKKSLQQNYLEGSMHNSLFVALVDREFTMNSLHMDIYQDIVIDPTGRGASDAMQKVLVPTVDVTVDLSKDEKLRKEFFEAFTDDDAEKIPDAMYWWVRRDAATTRNAHLGQHPVGKKPFRYYKFVNRNYSPGSEAIRRKLVSWIFFEWITVNNVYFFDAINSGIRSYIGSNAETAQDFEETFRGDWEWLWTQMRPEVAVHLNDLASYDATEFSKSVNQHLRETAKRVRSGVLDNAAFQALVEDLIADFYRRVGKPAASTAELASRYLHVQARSLTDQQVFDLLARLRVHLEIEDEPQPEERLPGNLAFA